MFEDDIFVEEMVVRRKGLLNLLLSVLIIVAAVVLALAVWLFVPFISSVLMLIILFGGYLGVKFQYVEYEYSFTNGDLDIDKIMAKRKRTRVLEINQKQIQVMAPYTAEYESETKDYQVSQVLDVSSSKNAAGRWFFIYEKTDGTYGFVVMQPSKQMREAFQKYLRSRMKGME
jgi:uncharacterized membrane protein YdbT with pleckstrin-like domain